MSSLNNKTNGNHLVGNIRCYRSRHYIYYYHILVGYVIDLDIIFIWKQCYLTAYNRLRFNLNTLSLELLIGCLLKLSQSRA